MSAALPQIPPGYRSEDLPRHEIRNRNQILYLLRGLFASNALISLTPAHQRWNSITSILDLEDARLTLDRAHDAELNRQLLSGIEVTFSAKLDGVPIVFVTGGAQGCAYEGRDVLSLPLPDCVYRLQRREFFRVHLPLANPVLCRVPHQPDSDIAGFTVPVVDMSMGGIAFTDDSGREPLETGTRLEACQLFIPDLSPAEVTLEVRDCALIPCATA